MEETLECLCTWKVKIFAWRGCLDSLPTRTKLSRRRIPVEEACLFCHGTIETVEHVLRDCAMAAMVWFSSLGLRVDGSHNMSLMAWVAEVAHQVSIQSFDLVLMILWGI